MLRVVSGPFLCNVVVSLMLGYHTFIMHLPVLLSSRLPLNNFLLCATLFDHVAAATVEDTSTLSVLLILVHLPSQ